MKCTTSPDSAFAAAGDTVRIRARSGMTWRRISAVTGPLVAVSRAEPGASPVTTPESVTRRTVRSEEDQAIGSGQGCPSGPIEAAIHTGKPEGSGDSGARRTRSLAPSGVSSALITGRRSASGSVHTAVPPGTGAAPPTVRVTLSSVTVVRTGVELVAGSGPVSGPVPGEVVAHAANDAEAVIRRAIPGRPTGQAAFTFLSRSLPPRMPQGHPRIGSRIMDSG